MCELAGSPNVRAASIVEHSAHRLWGFPGRCVYFLCTPQFEDMLQTALIDFINT